MYLRRHDKKGDGEHYGYWSLVESVRTARGPRQRIVATIGKLPGLDREERIGWEEIRRIIDGKPAPQFLWFWFCKPLKCSYEPYGMFSMIMARSTELV